NQAETTSRPGAKTETQLPKLANGARTSPSSVADATMASVTSLGDWVQASMPTCRTGSPLPAAIDYVMPAALQVRTAVSISDRVVVDEVEAVAGATTEVRVADVDTAVDDVGVHDGAAGRRRVPVVKRQHRLVDPVQAPRRVDLGVRDAHDVVRPDGRHVGVRLQGIGLRGGHVRGVPVQGRR